MNDQSFYINVNGKPSTKYALRRISRGISRAFIRETVKCTSDIYNDLSLAYFDWQEGTHLYAELQAKRKAARIQAQRNLYSL